MGSLRVRHDWVTSLSLFTFMHWRKKWQPTPGFLPGESLGWGSLVGCCLWVTQGRTRLKQLSSKLLWRASLVAQRVKNVRAMQEMQVQSLGLEDPLEKGMTTHSSILAWKISWTEEPGGLQSMGSLRVRHDWTILLSLFTFMHWRRKWQPTPAFLPGESQG